MTTTDSEYYLLAELITMPDRVLAQKIELLIWAKSPIPNEAILCKFLELLEASDDASEFYSTAEKYVAGFRMKWSVDISPPIAGGEWVVVRVRMGDK